MGQLSIPATRPSPQLLTLDGFRAAVRKDPDLDPASVLVLRDFEGDDVEVKARQETTGQVYDWACSSDSVDRDQDTLSPKGWDLKTYKKAPVWLAFHDSSQPEIGVSTSVGIEEEKLLSTMKFGPTAMAQSMKQMLDWRLEQRALSDAGGSCSVGFLPTKWDWAPDGQGRDFGIDFEKQELLEISIVPIGSNRDAMLSMKAAGVDCGPVADWADRYRRSASGFLTVDLLTAESIVQALAPSTGLKLFQMSPAAVAALSSPLPAQEEFGTGGEPVARTEKAATEGAQPGGEQPVLPETEVGAVMPPIRAMAQAPEPSETPALAASITALVQEMKADRVERSTETAEPTAKGDAPEAQPEAAAPDPAKVIAFAESYALELAEQIFVARTGQTFSNTTENHKDDP